MISERKVGQRIYIRGTSGSGKSTLGRELGRRLGIPHTEIDSLYHLPGWKPCPTEEFREKARTLVAPDAWVIDGNYSAIRDLVLARVDTVIWLDYPLSLVLWRLTWRILRRGIRREELWNGNRERLFWHFFTRDSLYLWVFKTYRKRHRESIEFMEDPANAHLIRYRFTKPRQLDEWLSSL